MQWTPQADCTPWFWWQSLERTTDSTVYSQIDYTKTSSPIMRLSTILLHHVALDWVPVFMASALLPLLHPIEHLHTAWVPWPDYAPFFPAPGFCSFCLECPSPEISVLNSYQFSKNHLTLLFLWEALPWTLLSNMILQPLKPKIPLSLPLLIVLAPPCWGNYKNCLYFLLVQENSSSLEHLMI